MTDWVGGGPLRQDVGRGGSPEAGRWTGGSPKAGALDAVPFCSGMEVTGLFFVTLLED